MHVGYPINFPRRHIPACFGEFPRLSGVNCPSCSRSPALALSAGSMCRGTAPANSSSSGTKLRLSPEARSKASTGTTDVPCTSAAHHNRSRMRQKSSQNLQQPRVSNIKLRCYDLERTNWFGVLSGAYTFRVRFQTIYRVSLSDTRHTSVDITCSGLPQDFIRAFLPPESNKIYSIDSGLNRDFTCSISSLLAGAAGT